MRYPPNIQKIEIEKRHKKREELRDITSPLRIKRKMKPLVLTRPKDLPKLREVDQLKERVRSYQRTRLKNQKTYLSRGKFDQRKERMRPCQVRLWLEWSS